MVRVVPYIGTWIETLKRMDILNAGGVVPYIGTWIETLIKHGQSPAKPVVPYIGTWIETPPNNTLLINDLCRTLYRYVD